MKKKNPKTKTPSREKIPRNFFDLLIILNSLGLGIILSYAALFGLGYLIDENNPMLFWMALVMLFTITPIAIAMPLLAMVNIPAVLIYKFKYKLPIRSWKIATILLYSFLVAIFGSWWVISAVINNLEQSAQ